MKPPVNYSKQILQKEWLVRKEIILNSFNHQCQKCGEHRPEVRGIWLDNSRTFEELFCDGYYQLDKIDKLNKRLHISSVEGNEIVKIIGKVNTIKVNKLLFAYSPLFYPNNGHNDPHERICFDTELNPKYNIDLIVRHKFYILRKPLLEYKKDHFTVVCKNCQAEYYNTGVPVFRDSRTFVCYVENCTKCEGMGFVSDMYHRNNGICYSCKGKGGCNQRSFF